MGCAPLSHMYCGRHRGIQNAQREREVGVSRLLRRSGALGHCALPQYAYPRGIGLRGLSRTGRGRRRSGVGERSIGELPWAWELRHAKRAA